AVLTCVCKSAMAGRRLFVIAANCRFGEGVACASASRLAWILRLLIDNVLSRNISMSKDARRLGDEVVRHTLRHTAITHLVQAGVGLPTVKHISGPKTLIMVECYAHQNGAHIRAAMDALESHYTFHPLPTAQRR